MTMRNASETWEESDVPEDAHVILTRTGHETDEVPPQVPVVNTVFKIVDEITLEEAIATISKELIEAQILDHVIRELPDHSLEIVCPVANKDVALTIIRSTSCVRKINSIYPEPDIPAKISSAVKRFYE